MSRRLGLAARGLAAASLVAGCLLAGTPGTAEAAAVRVALAIAAPVLGALPLVPFGHSPKPWTAPLTLAGFTGLAAVGLWLGLGAGWALLAVVCALCAWDLEHLEQMLSNPAYAGPEAGRQVMEAEHVRRLLVVASVGLLLGTAALLAEARITFLPALLLSLLALLGLRWVVSLFRAWDQ